MPPATVVGTPLTAEQIDVLVDYLWVRVIGRSEVTRQECVEYYGDPANPDCARYP